MGRKETASSRRSNPSMGSRRPRLLEGATGQGHRPLQSRETQKIES